MAKEKHGFAILSEFKKSVRIGNFELAQKIVSKALASEKHKFDINQISEDGKENLLSIAIIGNDLSSSTEIKGSIKELCRFLLSKDAKVRNNLFNIQPIDIAVRSGDFDIVKLLILHGADINDIKTSTDLMKKSELQGNFKNFCFIYDQTKAQAFYKSNRVVIDYFPEDGNTKYKELIDFVHQINPYLDMKLKNCLFSFWKQYKKWEDTDQLDDIDFAKQALDNDQIDEHFLQVIAKLKSTTPESIYTEVREHYKSDESRKLVNILSFALKKNRENLRNFIDNVAQVSLKNVAKIKDAKEQEDTVKRNDEIIEKIVEFLDSTETEEIELLLRLNPITSNKKVSSILEAELVLRGQGRYSANLTNICLAKPIDLHNSQGKMIFKTGEKFFTVDDELITIFIYTSRNGKDLVNLYTLLMLLQSSKLPIPDIINFVTNRRFLTSTHEDAIVKAEFKSCLIRNNVSEEELKKIESLLGKLESGPLAKEESKELKAFISKMPDGILPVFTLRKAELDTEFLETLDMLTKSLLSNEDICIRSENLRNVTPRILGDIIRYLHEDGGRLEQFKSLLNRMDDPNARKMLLEQTDANIQTKILSPTSTVRGKSTTPIMVPNSLKL